MFNLRSFSGGGRVASRDDHFVQKAFIKYLHGLIGPFCMTGLDITGFLQRTIPCQMVACVQNYNSKLEISNKNIVYTF